VRVRLRWLALGTWATVGARKLGRLNGFARRCVFLNWPAFRRSSAPKPISGPRRWLLHGILRLRFARLATFSSLSRNHAIGGERKHTPCAYSKLVR
jgi:hypothetical protein